MQWVMLYRKPDGNVDCTPPVDADDVREAGLLIHRRNLVPEGTTPLQIKEWTRLHDPIAPPLPPLPED